MATNTYAPLENYTGINFMSPEFYTPGSGSFLSSSEDNSSTSASKWQAGYNFQLGNSTGYDSPSVYGLVQQSNNQDFSNTTSSLLNSALNSTVLQRASGSVGEGMSGLSTAGAIAGGIGTIASAYEGASTNTGASVLSGAASGAISGAEIGTAVFPVIGTVAGAVIGAVVGGIAGFFGSKSKKAQQKKAYQQALEQAVAPQRQAEANYLQNQGLLQKAIGNYKSAYTPGGYQYTNSLLGGGPKSAFGQPTQPPDPVNFNVAPADIATGKPPTPYSTPNAATAQNTPNPLTGSTTGSAPPNYSYTPPVQGPLVAPQYSGNKAQDQASIQAYKQAYLNQLQSQNQAGVANAVGNYAQYYGGQGY